MKIDIKKYPQHKDTNIDWIGEVPEHWGIEKGKWLFNKENRPTRADDKIVTSFRDGEVTLRENRRTGGFTNALKEHGYQGVRKGDLVIHAMDAFAGAIGVSDSDGKSTPVYSVCTPRFNNNVAVHYYSFLLRNLALTGFIESLAKGIRERSTDFRFNDFGSLDLPVPPLSEQKLIANYLDEKTAKLDQAIAQKQKIIDLLKERKQILINNAVTRGLNPDTPLKDSGIEWIGEIPEHWEVRKLKYCVKMLTSNVDKHTKPNEIAVKLCNYVDVYHNDKIIAELDFMEVTATQYEIDRFKISINDVIITKDSEDWKDIGVPSWVIHEEENLICGYHLAILRPYGKIIYGGYLHHSLLCNFTDIQMSIGANGVTRYGISQGAINNLLLITPPLPEQEAIVSYIEEHTVKIDKAINQAESTIEKLKEYKNTLIDSAVRGKICLTD